MKYELEQRIAEVVKTLYQLEISIELTRPDEQFGDFATNVALQLAKSLGKNPREIANEIKENLTYKELQSTQVAGPGFINLTLTNDAILKNIIAEPTKLLTGQTVLVEYSDPNPFKPLHAGHLYTTLVGDVVARLIEYAGAKTIRLNFGGDVGLHAGKSMWAIIKHLGGEAPERLESINESERPSWLGDRYVEGNSAYEDDELAKAEIIETNKRIYHLHDVNDHDSTFAHIYWTCREWSYSYFATLYEQLQVAPFDRFIPESEVTPIGLQTVQEQTEAGVFETSDGAVIFSELKSGLHTRVFINSAGLPTYETKDIGLSLTKWRDYHPDKSIIITANEQEQYMQVVLAAIHEFEPKAAECTTHITHGVVKLQGGVKMSSRKGNIVSALDILESARLAANKNGMQSTEETMLSAVKYAFVKNRIGGDIIYEASESVALEGNSGPYLQYAHARARSILSKAQDTSIQSSDLGESRLNVSKLNDTLNEGRDPLELPEKAILQPDERSLARKLTEYPEIIEKATAELMPHHICTYLYELAQTFNRFYEHNRVIGDDREELRTRLVSTYADTLKKGLNLLGIHAPDKM